MSLELIAFFCDRAKLNMRIAADQRVWKQTRLQHYQLAEANFLCALSCRDLSKQTALEIREIRMAYRAEFGRSYNTDTEG